MSQQNEDSIEQFFRKAVVQQDKTFMERDWSSMEKMLDEQALLTSSQKKSTAKSLIVIAIVISTFTLLVLSDADNKIPNDSVQMQAAVGVVGPRRGVKTEGPTADLHSSIQDCGQIVSSPESPQQREQQVSVKPVIVNTHVADTKRNGTDEEYVIQNRNRGNLRGDVAAESEESRIDDSQTISGATLNLPELVVASVESLNSDSIATNITPTDVVSVVQDEAAEEKDKTERKVARFSITGLVSPDFSTTSLSKYSRPSNVFGLLIGYRIFKRVTIMTGATKSLKRYEGYGSDYTPPEGYWRARTNGVVPDQVEGKCGIIELPILIQVDLLQNRKNRVFVSAGVSSYLMRSEHYQYTFNEPNPGAADSWTAKEPTRYLFKIGHLSAGYDHVIANKFTIGIEPFLKIPFEGIGWTDINLYSTGAYINVRYNILNLPKP